MFNLLFITFITSSNSQYVFGTCYPKTCRYDQECVKDLDKNTELCYDKCQGALENSFQVYYRDHSYTGRFTYDMCNLNASCGICEPYWGQNYRCCQYTNQNTNNYSHDMFIANIIIISIILAISINIFAL